MEMEMMYTACIVNLFNKDLARVYIKKIEVTTPKIQT
jgi:hypothetical protein